MRLIHLAGYASPYAGAFIPMVREAMSQGKQRGWDTLAVFPEAARARPWIAELERDGVALLFAPEGSRRRIAQWLAGLLGTRIEPTILHSQFTQYDIGSVVAAKRSGGAAVLWHEQTALSRSPLVVARNIGKYGVPGRLVDGILCVNPEIAEDARRRGAPAKRTEYFPNAIDTGRFNPASEEERARTRAALGLPRDQVVLLHFGWDWRRKGGDLFLEAAAALRKAGVDAVAATVRGDGPARADMRRLALGEPAVRILEPVDDVRTLFAAADVFVSPSRAEGMTFAVIESLASGVPVVASDVSGHRIVGGDLAACRLTALDGASVAKEIRSLLARSPPQAASDADEARSRVCRDFDLKHWGDRLGARYEQALTSVHAGQRQVASWAPWPQPRGCATRRRELRHRSRDQDDLR